jgi:hypothetical protein
MLCQFDDIFVVMDHRLDFFLNGVHHFFKRTICLIPANPPRVCLFGQVFLPGGANVFCVIVELGDSDSVEGGHGHGSNRDPDDNEMALKSPIFVEAL